ncbi:MAG TPA: DNA-3-methyladenine glycosylase [Gemmatimonadales bacterium]|nr:DNA-3-methyladenine glycosylase [Gemmatimonadales bacterium]
MTAPPLGKAFYARPTSEVARRLLGHLVMSRIGNRIVVGRIVETEAYVGPHDPACHAFGHRRTARTEALYERPATAYVYFTYGMHWCLNVVTERVDYPAAVLIRALEPLEGLELMRRRRGGVSDRELCAGPARLCQALGITGAENRTSLIEGRVRILRGSRRRPSIAVTPRIGVTQAADWPLRFLIADSPWVSR